MADTQQEPPQNRKRLSAVYSSMLEIYIWLIIALVVAFRPLYFGLLYGFNSRDFFLDFYTEILFAILAFLFPYLFKLIYDELPFEFLRNRNKKSRAFIKPDLPQEDDYPLNKSKEESKIEPTEKNIEELHLLDIYLRKSQNVADKIYSRGGAYLLIGCLIAFAGVLFFYFQSINLHNTIKITDKDFDYSKLLLEYLPRIGTLIFVEAIAFFFLRQYRQTMEEFRYYEAIKRQRENQYAIFKLVNEYKDKPEIFDKLISYCSFNENPNKLIQGESTAIIEAEKVITKDSEIFDKLIELVKISKK